MTNNINCYITSK